MNLRPKNVYWRVRQFFQFASESDYSFCTFFVEKYGLII